MPSLHPYNPRIIFIFTSASVLFFSDHFFNNSTWVFFSPRELLVPPKANSLKICTTGSNRPSFYLWSLLRQQAIVRYIFTHPSLSPLKMTHIAPFYQDRWRWQELFYCSCCISTPTKEQFKTILSPTATTSISFSCHSHIQPFPSQQTLITSCQTCSTGRPQLSPDLICSYLNKSNSTNAFLPNTHP